MDNTIPAWKNLENTDELKLEEFKNRFKSCEIFSHLKPEN